MSDEQEGVTPQKVKKPQKTFKERCVTPTKLTMDEAKAAMAEAHDASHSRTQPAYSLAAKQPYFLNMVRELYNSKDIQPTKLTPEVLEEIVDRLHCGEALSAICQDDHIPAYKNLMKWMDLHPEVEVLIDKARMRGTHALVDVAMDVIQGGHMSTGDTSRDAETVKLIKWILGKRNTFYSENIKITHETEQRVFVLPDEVITGQLIEPKDDGDTDA